MPGGWTYQSYLTPYDSFIFYNAIGQHENYFYNPVSTRISQNREKFTTESHDV